MSIAVCFCQVIVDLELLEQHVGVHGNSADIGVIQVRPFLLTPAHHYAAELGVREGQALACH